MRIKRGWRSLARASSLKSGGISGNAICKDKREAGGVRLSFAALLLLGSSLAALTLGAASAATDTWNGGTSENWSDSGNWFLGSVPSTGDTVIIQQTTSGTAPDYQNISGLTVQSLTLDPTTNTTTNASGYIISNSTLEPLGLESGGSITDSATNEVSDQINTGIELNGHATITVTSGATGLTIGGDGSSSEAITGTGGLTISNSGTNPLIFGADNSYSGGTTISTGTLQLGTGGTTGIISGAVVDDGNLAFDRSNNITYSGNISGTGSVTQLGSGTLTLSGTNSYGATYIDAGTVSVASDSNLGSGAITMATQTTLDITSTGSFTNAVSIAGSTAFNIASTTTTTWSGLISDGASSGALQVSGGGTLILTNNETYTGGTSVTNDSILQLGSGGTSGMVQGSATEGISVATGSEVAFDHSNDVTYAGYIVGGTLVQEGSDILTLTGAAAPTTTTISSGTLQIGNGGTSGSLSGGVTDDSALAFDLSSNTTFSGAITGTGSVTQSGSGTLTLSGTNSYGDTNINSGTLSVASDSNLGTGTVAMAAGTTLDVTATGTFTNAVTLTGDPTFNIASGTTTSWSGLISDGGSAGTLNVYGGGTLVLEDASNSYSGGTVVAGGSTLSIGADGDLGASSGSLQLGDSTTKGTLSVTSGFTLGSSRSVSIAAGGGEIDTASSVDFEITQGIGGTGGLTVGGTGTLILTGTSSYGGGTTISSGATLQLGDGTNEGVIANNVTDNGALVFDAGGNQTFSGVISGTGTLTQDDSGGNTLTLSGANTFTGGIAVEDGTLSITTGGASGTNLSTNTVTLEGGGLLANGTGDTISNAITLGTGGGTINVANGDSDTFSGAIGGSTGLTVNSDTGGTEILSGANTFTGGITVDGGILSVTTGGTSGTNLSTDAVTLNGATLLANGTGNTISNAITLDFGGGTINVANGDSDTFSGVIGGTTGLTVNSNTTGTEILSGANTFTGGIAVDGGTLSVTTGGTSGTNLSTNAVTLNGAVLLANGNSNTISNAITLGTGGGTINVVNSDSDTFSGVIGGTTGLTINSNTTGTVILSGTNTYSGGTAIDGGTLSIGAAGNLGGGTVAMANGTTFQMTSAITVTNAFAITGTGTIAADNDILSGDISDGTSAGTLDVTGGTLQLTGTNNYSGGTVVESGATLDIASSTNIGSGAVTLDGSTLLLGGTGGTVSNNVVLSGGGTINVPVSDSETISGVISGSGGLTINDGTAGTLILSGANTFTGGIAVDGGTLSVTTGGTTGTNLFTNAVTLNDATLLANGTGQTISNGITLGTGGGTINVGSGDTDTFSGTIGGTTGLTVNNGTTGTVVLSGTNSYSGGTTIDGGIVSIAAAANLGAGTVVINDATLLVSGTGQTIANAVTLDATGATINVANGNSDTFSGAIGGSAGLVVNSNTTGTEILSGANTFTGGIAVDGGTLSVATGGTSGTNLSTNTVTLNDATLLASDTGQTISNAITLGTGGGTIDVANGDSDTFSGIIGGTTGLIVNSNTTGTVILSGANTFTGGIAVDGGTLSAATGGASGTNLGTNAVTLNDAALLANTNGNTISNAITLGTGGGTIDVANGDSDTFSGIIGGTTGLTINSGTTGTAILSGTNTYSGGTNLDGGTLSIGAPGNLGGGTLAMSAGTTLQITATGAFTNAVTLTGDPTFNVAPSTTTTWSGIIADGSSPGTLNLTGGGTLVLTAANTYSGGTTISAGTLQIGNGGSTGSIVGNVTDNTVLAFDESSSVTFAGAITGTGSLDQNGSGTLILTGSNSFNGGTTISSGVLQIGNGGTSGSLTGAVTDDTSLVFDESGSSTFAGTVSGSGSVEQAGSGTTILTSANNYGGGTTISAGTLQIGDGGSTGSITGAVTDNGTLSFDLSNASTFGGVISGSGGVDQIGSGTLTLTGTSNYSGATTVSDGTLLVNGSIVNSAATVNSGGTIGGSGTIGSLTIANGGTVAPGNGVAEKTLNVAGNLNLAAGSTYLYDVTPTSSDSITVGGTATLAGTLEVNPIGISAPPGTLYKVVTASGLGGVTGTFSSVMLAPGAPTNLTPLVYYNANEAELSFLPTASLPTSATPGNQGQVEQAVDFAIMHDNATALVPITALTGTALTTTLAQMSGEGATGVQNVAVQGLTSFLDMMLDPTVGGRGGLGDGGNDVAYAAGQSGERLAYNGSNGSIPYERPSQRTFTVWASVDGGAGYDEGSTAFQSHNITTSEIGGAFGIDYRPSSGNGALGIALGVNQGNWNIGSDLGKGEATAYQVGAYYSRRWDSFYFSSGFAYSQYRATTDRTLDFNSAVDDYHAGFNPWSEALRAEFGNTVLLPGSRLTPYVRFQAEDVGLPSYAETTLAGSDSFALTYTGKEMFDYNTELGTAWNTVLSSERAMATDLHARVGWVHDFEGNLDVTSTFSQFNGASFIVTGAHPPRDAAHLELGIEQDVGVVALTLNAESLIGGTGDNYGGTAAMAVRW